MVSLQLVQNEGNNVKKKGKETIILWSTSKGFKVKFFDCESIVDIY